MRRYAATCATRMVSAWDVELVRLGLLIDRARQSYVDQLAPVAQSLARRLLGMELALGYRSGWPKEIGLGDALADAWAHDQESGI